jgi:hypothetical protein
MTRSSSIVHRAARRPALAAAVLVTAALAGAQRRALAWGQDGHVIVARLAEKHLNATAKQQIKALLNGRELADVASAADDWRIVHTSTGAWHFVNIPRAATDFQDARDCAKRACAVDALADQLAKLSSTATPPAERRLALRFVVHLAGDLHQPLHAIDDGDHGGNDVKARLVLSDPEFPFDSGQFSSLHSLWDADLIDSAHRDQSTYVAQLQKLPDTLKKMQAGTAADWALEAHAVARDLAYGLLPAADATGVHKLDEAYAAQCRPAAELQLQRAGVRLARLLNEAFTPPK